MGRFQQVIRGLGFTAILAASGCMPQMLAKKPASPIPPAKAEPANGEPRPPVDPAVVQAGASVPASTTSSIVSSLTKTLSKNFHKDSRVDLGLTWQPKLAYLPDPSRNGEMRPGIVGQMFMFGPDSKPAEPTGNLVIEMFDESIRPGAAEPSHARIDGWIYDKQTLRTHSTIDERFGKCYVIYLPLREPKPTYTKLKITARYEPEHSYPIYAPASNLTLDTRTSNSPHPAPSSVGAFPAGFMGPSPALQTQLASPPLNPVPIGGRSATGMPGPPLTAPPRASTPAIPANLPPIAFTLPGR